MNGKMRMIISLVLKFQELLSSSGAALAIIHYIGELHWLPFTSSLIILQILGMVTVVIDLGRMAHN